LLINVECFFPFHHSASDVNSFSSQSTSSLRTKLSLSGWRCYCHFIPS